MAWTIKTYDGTTETTRNPVFDAITFEDSREEGQVYYRKECTTTFIFQNAEYTYFKGLLDTNYCGTLELRLYWNGILKYTGNLNLRLNSKFDVDNCRVELTATPEDNYNALFANWEREINILNIPATSSVTSKIIIGTIESTFVTTSGTVPDDPPGPAANTWTLVSSSYDSGLDITDQTFKRETITIACDNGNPVSPGADWTLAEDNCGSNSTARYVRGLRVYLIESTTDTLTYGIIGVDTNNNVDEYDNGRLWSDVIDYFITQAGFSLVSDFFNINPDNTHPSNDPYTAADPNLHNLLIYQKSDIKRFDAAQNATVGRTTLKNLLEFLDIAFDVKYSISGSTIRLEHVSYYTATNGEDLTSTSPLKVAGFNNFTFDEQDTYAQEKYLWMDEDFRGGNDFIGQPITYNCGDPEEEPLELTAEEFVTDISGILANPDNYEDKGFVLIACGSINSDYFILRETGQISNAFQLNAHLSWANLHHNYKRYDRPQPTGTINGNAVTFASVRPKKRQEVIVIHKTVDQYFSINFSQRIRSGLGWGEVETAVYNSKDCSLQITLLHD